MFGPSEGWSGVWITIYRLTVIQSDKCGNEQQYPKNTLETIEKSKKDLQWDLGAKQIKEESERERERIQGDPIFISLGAIFENKRKKNRKRNKPITKEQIVPCQRREKKTATKCENKWAINKKKAIKQKQKKGNISEYLSASLRTWHVRHLKPLNCVALCLAVTWCDTG